MPDGFQVPHGVLQCEPKTLVPPLDGEANGRTSVGDGPSADGVDAARWIDRRLGDDGGIDVKEDGVANSWPSLILASLTSQSFSSVAECKEGQD